MGIFDRIASAFRREPAPVPGREPGRNDECWCGSGVKYKRCHLDADRRRVQSQRTSCRTSS
jgi:hypothetical protein